MSSIKKYNLTEGKIASKLFLVALPLMGTQFMQMAYNLTDMFWLGRINSDAVASVGVVGFYMWLSVAFFLFGRMGAEIGVSQNIGKGDMEEAQAYGQNAIVIAAVLGISLATIFIVAREPLIAFFGIGEAHVAADAQEYLMIVSFGFPFVFVAMAIAGIFSGSGNTRTVMWVSASGFSLNMLLTPILIFPAGLAIRGAAVATVIANTFVFSVSLIVLFKHKKRPFEKMNLFVKPNITIIKQIMKWVSPVSLESFLFTVLTMIVTVFIAIFGSGALAASRVVSQIESLTWLIAGGFSTAITAYVGQNYGAEKWLRIRQGFYLSTGLMAAWGAVVSLILFFLGAPLLRIFLPTDPDIVEIGTRFLRMLAVIQIPACLEGVAAGMFRGQGKTIQPSISSVISNVSRVLLTFIFTRFTGLGLDGIWLAITVSAGIRGTWVFIWYAAHSRKLPKTDLA